jgi:hypothetical protein
MDVHRDFCEIAIAEAGARVRSAGRISSTLDELRLGRAEPACTRSSLASPS